MAQVAIRWLLQKNVVSSVIIGATSTKQIESNVAASGGWELSKEEVTLGFITLIRVLTAHEEMAV